MKKENTQKVTWQKRFAAGLLTAVVAVATLFSSIPATTVSAATTSTTDYQLADNIQDGNIIQMFDWTYNDIKAEMKNIAEAGFTTIQTSPAQTSSGAGEKWYMLYQPTDLAITSNGLGTRDELAALCTEAHKYGVKVIVDVVANHLRGDCNSSDGIPTYLARDYNDSLWHDGVYDTREGRGTDPDWNNRYQVTHANIGMWDLNSENDTVAYYVKNYVNDLKSLGVDGIRWDAAKHIALPSENCNFWKIVTDTGLYNYGEILSGPCNGAGNNDSLMKEYTNYMSVTDSDYSSNVFYAIAESNLSSIMTEGNYTTRGVSKNKLVYWAESHDTYSNNTSNGTQCYSQFVVDKAYAIVASQLGANALYYSRPSSTNKESILIGQKGSTHFTCAQVAAVNKFHNAMGDLAEWDVKDYSDNAYAVCRGNGSTAGGAVIVLTNKDESNKYVNVENGGNYVPNGTYIDQVSGNTFTVANGVISGYVGSTGIAVIYKAQVSGPSISADQDSQTYTSDLTVNYTIDADSYEITVDGVVNNSLTQTYSGKTVEVCITATKNNQTKTVTYNYKYEKPSELRTIYLDTSACSWFGNNSAVAAIKTNKDSTFTKMSTTTANGKTVYTTQVSSNATSATIVRMLPSGLYYNEKTISLGNTYNYYTSDDNWTSYTTSYYSQDEYKTPSISLSKEEGTYEGAVTVDITVSDAQTATYTLDGVTTAISNGEASVTISSTKTLTVNAVNGDKSATKTATYTITEEPNPDTITVYFTNNYNWSNVYAYTWGGTTNTSSWPGTKMTYVKQNEYNQAVYKIEISADVKGLIFNNGSGQQTVDITSGITDGIGYYLSNNSSKASVGSYTFQ